MAAAIAHTAKTATSMVTEDDASITLVASGVIMSKRWATAHSQQQGKEKNDSGSQSVMVDIELFLSCRVWIDHLLRGWG